MITTKGLWNVASTSSVAAAQSAPNNKDKGRHNEGEANGTHLHGPVVLRAMMGRAFACCAFTSCQIPHVSLPLYDDQSDYGENGRSDQTSPPELFCSRDIKTVTRIKIEVTQTCEVVIPDAQNREAHDDVAEP